MSRALTVARNDLRHAVRDRLAWGALVLLGLLFLPSAATIASPDVRPIDELLLTLPLDLLTFALVVVAAVGYNAVGGERETGTVRTVLGLSATRRDLVLGKFLARGAVVTLALVVVLAVANGFVALGYGDPYLVPFWVMAGSMVGYGLVWTAVTVGYSAAFASQYRSLGALVVTYATFSPSVGVWSLLVRPVFALAFTGSTATPAYETLATAPLWLRVTERLNPIGAFFRAMQWAVAAVGPGTPVGSAPVQLFGAAVFLAFGVVGLGVGLWRFDRADLSRNDRRPWWRRRLGDALRRVASVRLSAGGRSRVLTVARADLRHALQNWVVAGTVALFLLLVGPNLWSGLDANSVATAGEQVADIPDTFSLPVLVLGIAVGYGAVVGERESGTVRLVLGAAGNRRELVAGKLLARLAVVTLAVAPTVFLAEALVAMRFGALFPVAFLAWAGWVLALAFVWTAFVVGVSAAVSTRYRTLAGVFGTYLLFGTGVGLWGPVVRPLISLGFTGDPSAYESYVYAVDHGPLWFRYTDALNPLVALQTIRDGVVWATTGSSDATVPLPLFLFSLVVASLFAVLPLLVGYRRFERADLG